MDKKGLSMSTVVSLLLLLLLLTIAGPLMADWLNTADESLQAGTSCEVGGLGKGVCKKSCNAAAGETPSPLECGENLKCCIQTRPNPQQDRLEAPSYGECDTPGSTSECEVDRTICASGNDFNKEEDICVTLCDYCAENPGAEQCQGKDVTSKHSCSCTAEEGQDYDEVVGLCPSTNPSDTDYRCCIKETAKDVSESSFASCDKLERKQEFNTFVNFLQACQTGSQSACDNAAQTLKRELVTSAEWKIIINGGDRTDDSSTISLARGGDSWGSTQYCNRNLDFEMCHEAKFGVDTLVNIERIYYEDGQVYYSVENWADQELNTLEPKTITDTAGGSTSGQVADIELDTACLMNP